MRIGVPIIGSKEWRGGLVYVQNALRALQSLQAGNCSCSLIVDPKKAPLLQDHREIISEGFCNEILWVGVHGVVDGIQLASKTLNSWGELNDHVDCIFPWLSEPHPEIPVIPWIPDLQDTWLPEFFSQRELEIRSNRCRSISSQCELVVFSSQDAEEDFRRFYPKSQAESPVLHFYYTMPAETFLPDPMQVAEKYGVKEEFALCSNQLWAHKDHRTLFEAISCLHSEGQAPLLFCTGSASDYRNSEYYQGLMGYLDSLELGNRVKILGLIPRADQLRLIRGARCMLQPSLFEGWSTVLGDARSMGCPMVHSDLKVHIEQAVPNSLAFKAKSAEDLASHLKTGLSVFPASGAKRETEGCRHVQDKVRQFGQNLRAILNDAVTSVSPADPPRKPITLSPPSIQGKASRHEVKGQRGVQKKLHVSTPHAAPCIALVTPSYNQSAYLEETMDSILSQGYPNLQYVVMDGGSTDGSVDIIRKYEKHLHHWQSQSDGGMYHAINAGFAKTDSALMGWQNSDDKLTPNALAKLAWAFAENPASDWLVGKATLLDEQGRIYYVEDRPAYYSLGKCLDYHWEQPYFQPQDATFWRRELWDCIGGALDTQYRLAADFWLWTRFFLQQAPLYLDSFIGGYRVTHQNAAIVQKDRYAAECRQIVDLLKQDGRPAVHPMTEQRLLNPESLQNYCAERGIALLAPSPARGLESQWADLLSRQLDQGHLRTAEMLEKELELLKISGSNSGDLQRVLDEVRPLRQKLSAGLSRARQEQASGNKSGALELYSSLTPFLGQQPEELCSYCELLVEQGQSGRAVELLQQSLQRYPADERVAELAFALLNEQGCPAEAQAVEQAFRVIRPEYQGFMEVASPAHSSESSSSGAVVGPYAELRHKLEDPAVVLLSLDFFDTLVSRIAPRPTAVFIEIGRRLQASGLLQPQVSVHSFRVLRETAEQQSRLVVLNSYGNSECRLEDIYAQLTHVVTSVEDAIKVEVQTECDYCQINVDWLQIAQDFKARGGSVCVLSDMYLHSDHLLDILDANGVSRDLFDTVWTSGDLGFAKHSGAMFDHLLKVAQIQPQQVVHVGDNEHADVKVPASKGFQTVFFPRLPFGMGLVFDKERMLAGEREVSCAVDALRVLSMQRQSGAEVEYARIGAGVFGPLLAQYADWVVMQCREQGIDTVFSLMREGELLAELIERSAQRQQIPLRVEIYYTSRTALKVPSLGQPDLTKLLLRVAKRGGKMSLQEILEVLELPTQWFDDGASDLSAVVDIQTTCSMLCQSETIRNYMAQVSEKRRKPAVAYLQQKLAGARRVAIVDLGYRGMMQKFLVDMAQIEAIDVSFSGLYFSTSAGSARQVLMGCEMRGMLGECGTDNFLLHPFRGHPEILEQGISSSVGTTKFYQFDENGAAQPVLGEYHGSELEATRKAALRQGILDYQQIWLDVLTTKPWLLSEKAQVVRNELAGQLPYMIHRLFAFPEREEAALLGNLKHDDGDGFHVVNSICDDRSREAFRTQGYQGLIANRPYWHCGVVALEKPENMKQFFETWHLHARM